MKALNVAIDPDVSLCLFQGVVMAEEGCTLSHLFYTDDDMFLGEYED